MRRVALAAAFLALCAVAAGYVRSTTRSDPSNPGPCLYWSGRHIAFSVNDKGTGVDKGGCDPGTSFAAVDSAFKAWASAQSSSTGAACTDLSFSGSTVSSVETGYDASGPNTNLVVWRQKLCSDVVKPGDPCVPAPNCSQSHTCPSLTCANEWNCWEHDDGTTIALTTTTFRLDSGEILDADTELFGWDGTSPETGAPLGSVGPWYFTCVTPPGETAVCERFGDSGCVATDVQNTMTHEAGHFLGLAHSSVPDATMFASASPGDVGKRSLSPDDVQGICAIYPRGEPTATCGDPKSSGCGCGPGGAPGGALILFALLALRRVRVRR